MRRLSLPAEPKNIYHQTTGSKFHNQYNQYNCNCYLYRYTKFTLRSWFNIYFNSYIESSS